jgi:hypothetical protein
VPDPDPRIPAESDWIEFGTVLETGPPGAWDALLAGASTPSSVAFRDGTYFLYYGGADGKRSTDDGPRHRAIGVATSRDGLRFTKHPGNPVVSHLPTDGEEEGANSAAVALDDTGQFVMFYGAATQITPHSINADGRVATSSSGLDWVHQDLIALDHTNPDLYGSGDEIFPLATYRYGGNWYVYYVANGGRASRDVGVAWGPSWEELSSSALAVDGNSRNPARVGGNISWLGNDTIVVFVQRGWHPNISVEVRLAHAGRPHELSRPMQVYDGPLWQEETKFVTAFLDRERKTWFLYRSTWQGTIVLHLAPYGEPDATPPSAPSKLAAAKDSTGITLTWSAADDPDTGVARYRVYRDGVLLGATADTTFVDSGVNRPNEHGYEVSAVNLHGTEGPPVRVRR